MNDQTFYAIWILSFILYFTIYTLWIPLKTQLRIEKWLRSSESDDTLLLSLDVIVKQIREQMLHDFEEYMLPKARENLQKFWSGAMGNAAKEIGKTEEGSNLSMLSNMAKDLSGQPWYIQAAASKLLPLMENAAAKGGTATKVAAPPMGIGK